MKGRKNTTADFWAKVDKSDECWIWTGGRSPKGYGIFWWHGKAVRAHRFVWELANRPIPKGFIVCHSCDNPPCCRPEHLFLSTITDNQADKVSKDRQAKGNTHGMHLRPERRPYGKRNGRHTHPEGTPRGDAHWSRRMPERRAKGERNGSYTHPERRPYGNRNGTYTRPESRRYGEANNLTNLTEEHVIEIRNRYSAGGISQRALAHEYHVVQSTIGNIINKRTWVRT
jgi:hypothetical protein